MDPRFQAFIEAAVERAKAESNLLWADDLAQRIASSTPLPVEASVLAEQLTYEAVRAGVAVTVSRSRAEILRAAAA
jgi:hypothetical protein